MLLIVVSVTTAVLKSVPQIGREHGDAARCRAAAHHASASRSSTSLRIWIAPDNPGAAGAARERLRYVFSLPGLVDLVAAIPFALAPHLGLNLDWLDIVPIFKLLRHTAAFQFMVEAVYSERRVLWSAAVLMLVLLVFQSSVVYYFEREAQPDKYGSIPEAMWWGIVTLTTVGYGDVTPVTLWGRIAGGLTAVMGLCMFAIPVGIIASAFIEAVRRREFVDTWNLVAKVPLFRTLDAARIAAVAGVLRARRAERGERLIRKGDQADSMYFIVSGEVEVDQETGAPQGAAGRGRFLRRNRADRRARAHRDHHRALALQAAGAAQGRFRELHERAPGPAGRGARRGEAAPRGNQRRLVAVGASTRPARIARIASSVLRASGSVGPSSATARARSGLGFGQAAEHRQHVREIVECDRRLRVRFARAAEGALGGRHVLQRVLDVAQADQADQVVRPAREQRAVGLARFARARPPAPAPPLRRRSPASRAVAGIRPGGSASIDQ